MTRMLILSVLALGCAHSQNHAEEDTTPEADMAEAQPEGSVLTVSLEGVQAGSDDHLVVWTRHVDDESYRILATVDREPGEDAAQVQLPVRDGLVDVLVTVEATPEPETTSDRVVAHARCDVETASVALPANTAGSTNAMAASARVTYAEQEMSAVECVM